MSKRHAQGLFAASAAVLAAVLGVTAALAASTWTVRPGGPVSLNSGMLILKDVTTGANFTCTSAGFSGTLKSGSGLPGTRIGSLTAVTITNCTTPLGATFILTATDLPWHVNLTSYHAATGVVIGSFSHMQIKMSGPACRAVIDGTSGTASNGILRFTYTNGTGKLKTGTTGGNLHFYNVSGCFGAFRTGDLVTLAGTFNVSPKQAITTP